MDNQDLNPTQGNLSDQEKLIQEAMARVSIESAKRAEQLEKEQIIEEPEIPETLDDVGKHSVQEMGVLARIGKDTHSFDFFGNRITLRTLTVGEELEILSRCNSFPPNAQSKAYVIYTTACSIELVNGKPYFNRLPLGPKDDLYNYKFHHFLGLYNITINTFIDEYRSLRQKTEDQARYAKKG